MGRHSLPSNRKKNFARVATAAVLSGIAGSAFATPAMANPLDAIVQCESGGDIRAQNPTSSASGKYQFIDSTWRAMGGTGKAKNASEAEQDMRAQMLYEQQGTAPWNASKSCWAGKSGEARIKAQPTKAAAPVQSSSSGDYVVRKGDTLSKIAAANGTTWRALAEKNGIANPNLIYVGQSIDL